MSGEGIDVAERARSIDNSMIDAAAARLDGVAHRTPVLRSSYFDRRTGGALYFKCENLQKVGAFKFRGAFNTVASLSDAERARGVVTHSSGNHAQALALAARLHGTRAVIVMPRNAPMVKLAAVRDYGAEVRLCEPTHAAREAETAKALEETGGVLVHPFDDPRIIAGQATAAKELIEDSPPLDLLIAPVGGGGLISGTSIVAHSLSPGTRVVGAEPVGADDAALSLRTGKRQPARNPKTLADGLLAPLSELTFTIVRNHVERIVTVDDEAIVAAMRQVWERMKIIIEPSAAVAVAAVLSERLDVEGRRVGIILSGGNVDLGRLPWFVA